MTSSTRTDSASILPKRSDQSLGGEHYVDASVGSPCRQDLLTHGIDISRGRGTIRFIGKVSEISWIIRAYSYLISPDDGQPGEQANTSQQSSAAQLGHFM